MYTLAPRGLIAVGTCIFAAERSSLRRARGLWTVWNATEFFDLTELMQRVAN